MVALPRSREQNVELLVALAARRLVRRVFWRRTTQQGHSSSIRHGVRQSRCKAVVNWIDLRETCMVVVSIAGGFQQVPDPELLGDGHGAMSDYDNVSSALMSVLLM